MLTDYYTDIKVYREVERVDDWGNVDASGNWEYSHTIKGFFQPVSASYESNNQSNNMTSTHRLYTSISSDIRPGDNILVNDKYYLINTIQDNGIAGMGKHMECGCNLVTA